MPRYYFHVDDGDTATPDIEGVDLPGLADARVQAATAVGELLRDRPEAFWDARDWTLKVEDQSGLVLFSILVSAVAAPAMAGLTGAGAA